MRGLRAIGAGALLIVGVVAFAVPVGAHTRYAATCSTAVRSDPYSLPAATLSACGFHRYPVSAVRSLPGGGQEFVYWVGKLKTTIPVPPKGFNALTATPGQLAEYSLPARPHPGTARTAWRARMRNLRPVTPPPELISSPVRATTTNTTNSHWSGYVATHSNSTHFFQATSNYTEPSLGSSVCSNNDVVIWSGLGGWFTGKLGQSGTIEFRPSGSGENQAWWEVLPDRPSIVLVNLFATVGRTFHSDVHYDGTKYNFFLQNNYTGDYLSINVTTSSYDGRSADFIVERPLLSGGFANLSNFGTMTLGNNWFNAGTYVGAAANLLKISMVNNSDGNTLATPGSIYNANKSFQVTQHHCN